MYLRTYIINKREKFFSSVILNEKFLQGGVIGGDDYTHCFMWEIKCIIILSNVMN